MGYKPTDPMTKNVPVPTSTEITDYRITKVTLGFQENTVEAVVEYTYGYMVDGEYTIGGSDSANFEDISSCLAEAATEPNMKDSLDRCLFKALVDEAFILPGTWSA